MAHKTEIQKDVKKSTYCVKIATIRTWFPGRKRSLRLSDVLYIGDCEHGVALGEMVKTKEIGMMEEGEKDRFPSMWHL